MGWGDAPSLEANTGEEGCPQVLCTTDPFVNTCQQYATGDKRNLPWKIPFMVRGLRSSVSARSLAVRRFGIPCVRGPIFALMAGR
jgi:hypothetical protein